MKRALLALGIYLSLSVAACATSLFGVCTTACTWNNSSTAMWSTSSGGATGAGPPGAADSVTFDGSTCVGGTTCTITLNAGGPINSITSLTMGACTASTTGCIFDNSVNNNNMTITGSGNAINISGSGTRNIKLGTATYTLTGQATFNAATVTNMTLSAASSIIAYTNSGTRGLNYGSGSITLGTFNIGAAASTLNTFNVVGTSATTTITALNISPPNTLYFPNSDTHITALNCNGTSSSQIMLTSTGAGNSTLTIPAGSIGQWCGVQGMVFTNAATLSNGFVFSTNTNLTTTAPGAGGGGCILGGWLLWRDFEREHMNDNFPAWLEKTG